MLLHYFLLSLIFRKIINLTSVFKVKMRRSFLKRSQLFVAYRCSTMPVNLEVWRNYDFNYSEKQGQFSGELSNGKTSSNKPILIQKWK